MHIKDNFSSGLPISQVPASWFNAVAKFINNLVGGAFVRIEKHDDGSASVIDVVDVATLGETAPVNVSTTAAAVGSSNEAARADHAHLLALDDNGGIENGANGLKLAALADGEKWMKTDVNGMPSVTDDEPLVASTSATGVVYNAAGTISYKGIGANAGQVAAGNHNHNSAYASKATETTASTALSTATTAGEAAQAALSGLGGKQDHSTKLDALDNALNSAGKVPLTQLTGNIDGHTGNCYVTIDNNGNLSHSGNNAYDMLQTAAFSGGAARTDNHKLITDADVGNGLKANATTHNLEVKCASGGGLSVDSNGVKMTELAASKWMKTNTNGYPTTTNDTPITASTSASGVIYNAAGTISYKGIGEGLQIEGDNIRVKSGGGLGYTADGTLSLGWIGQKSTSWLSARRISDWCWGLYWTPPVFDNYGRFIGVGSEDPNPIAYFYPGEV